MPHFPEMKLWLRGTERFTTKQNAICQRGAKKSPLKLVEIHLLFTLLLNPKEIVFQVDLKREEITIGWNIAVQLKLCRGSVQHAPS